MEALLKDRRYTYADYAKLNTEDRYELIDGMPYMMSPSPTWIHQAISSSLHREIANFLKGKTCRIFAAPFDVRLNAGDGHDTVVQPDLVVICDRSKLSDTGYGGAPDLVIEILSQSSAGRDKVLKFNQYLKAGVREYWIVDPDSKTVTVNILDNGRYYTTAYAETDTLPVNVLEGCVINLADVFAE